MSQHTTLTQCMSYIKAHSIKIFDYKNILLIGFPLDSLSSINRFTSGSVGLVVLHPSITQSFFYLTAYPSSVPDGTGARLIMDHNEGRRLCAYLSQQMIYFTLLTRVSLVSPATPFAFLPDTSPLQQLEVQLFNQTLAAYQLCRCYFKPLSLLSRFCSEAQQPTQTDVCVFSPHPTSLPLLRRTLWSSSPARSFFSFTCLFGNKKHDT